ncbi:MAG: DUF4184 family protein [Candidatus Lokiarchaeota archaeon]|nr:DUF4184 family protein [Candidatus Lokiarchaeota archaeon]
MPSSLLSHQAPALLLKIKYPKKFDGTALCISTFVPDIVVVIDPFFSYNLRAFTHSFLGLIVFTLPLTLLLTIVFCKYFAPFSANLARKKGFIFKPMRYFGLDQWDNLKKKKYNRMFYVVASYSALIGGITHLLLDLPAHATIDLFFPITLQSPEILLYSIIDFGPITIGEMQIERNLTIYQLIWMIETLVTFVITLYLLRYIKKRNLINKWYKEI